MKWLTGRTWLIIFATLALCPTSVLRANAVTYQFTDLGVGFPMGITLENPKINNNGRVSATVNNQGMRIVGLNNNDVIAFFQRGELRTRHMDGGPVTTIATFGDPGDDFSAIGGVSINDSGVVAFEAVVSGGVGGIYAGNGGPITTIADTSGPFGGFHRVGASPIINSAGVVAFSASYDEPFIGAAHGVFTGTGGPVTTLYDTDGPFRGFDGAEAYNDAGQTAFNALLDDGVGFKLYRGNGGPTDGPFPQANASASINAHGALAYLTGSNLDGRIIYVDPASNIQEVVAPGHPLFGSTVLALSPFRHGQLNDHGQIVFRYALTDGRNGIAVASPVPEPSSLLLAAVAGSGLLWRRRALHCLSVLVAVAGISIVTPMHARALTIDMVTVGNPGNAPDTRYIAAGSGSVDHVYKIGMYEVTAGQYSDFLNAVAKDDPNGLYNTKMADPTGGFSAQGANIQRTGSPGNYSYSIDAQWADRPVNYVSFWDAARFANWLHNGQPVGPQSATTTEDGAYHDVGDQLLFGRNTGAKFFLPTDDEWYKAAYHDAAAGVDASYFNYPFSSQTWGGNDITESTNPGRNANYFQGDFAIGSPYYRTVVGEYELSDSPYGTFDQAGNVMEWNETAFDIAQRGIRGGFYFGSNSGSDPLVFLHASNLVRATPTIESSVIGFRVASVIPEPNTSVLTICTLFAVAILVRVARI